MLERRQLDSTVPVVTNCSRLELKARGAAADTNKGRTTTLHSSPLKNGCRFRVALQRLAPWPHSMLEQRMLGVLAATRNCEDTGRSSLQRQLLRRQADGRTPDILPEGRRADERNEREAGKSRTSTQPVTVPSTCTNVCRSAKHVGLCLGLSRCCCTYVETLTAFQNSRAMTTSTVKR